MELLLIVLILVVIFGGWRSYSTAGWNSGSYGFGGVGLILFILLLWFLFGGGHHSLRF